MNRFSIKRALLSLVVVIGYLYLLVPIIVIIMASFGTSAYMQFPPQGFSLQWYGRAFEHLGFRNAFLYSLQVALWTTLLSVVGGGLAALGLANRQFPGRSVISSIFLSPLTVPGLVIGVAALTFASENGILPSIWRLVAIHVVITIPFVIRAILPSLEQVSITLIEAAKDLGCTSWQAFWLVTLPIARTAFLSAGVLAFLVSFDELTVSLFLAPVQTPTLPMLMYSAVEFSLDTTVAAVSTLTILISVVLVGISWLFTRQGPKPATARK
jgi:putative spermidine/putrescine transport system permease protein